MRIQHVLICATFMTFSFTSFAQLGFAVKTSYEFNSQDELQKAFSNTNFIDDIDSRTNGGYEVAINYWFRLKQKRIEFLPQLSYSHTVNSDQIVQNGDELYDSATRNSVGAMLMTQIYPLDFEGDCNCPTFSKQSRFFQKGFFWQIGLGAMGYKTTYTGDIRNDLTSDDKYSVKPHFSLGAGLDLGVTNLLTLTPYLNYNLTTHKSWNNHFSSTDLNDTPSLRFLQLALRATVRFDHKAF